MKETEVLIPIKGTKLNIHGVLRGNYTESLVILCHGLGGWMHEMLMFNAARYFDKQGIASLRVSFYGYGEDQRNINEYDVSVGAEDIDMIVDFVKKKGAHWVAVIGHSYSGMAIPYSSKQNFEAAVLWDPSHTDGYNTLEAQLNLEKDFKFDKELKAYISPLGSGSIISKKVFENYQPGSTEKSKQFKIPTLIVNASYSKEMAEYGKKYANSINAPTKQVVIPNTSHPFVEEGAIEKLYRITGDWLKQQLKTKFRIIGN